MGTNKSKSDCASVSQLPYFHSRITWTIAESLLQRNGDFLLRKFSADKGAYSIMIVWGGQVEEFVVKQVDNGYRCTDDGKGFPSVKDLIDHHLKTGDRLTKESDAALVNAKARQSWELLEADTAFGLQWGQMLGKGSFCLVHEVSIQKCLGEKIETMATKSINGWENLSAERKLHCRAILFKEAKAMLDLAGHPNIVRVRAVIVDTDWPSLLMDVNKGPNLKFFLTSNAVSTEAMLQYARDAASAIAYMHEKGYIHRGVVARKFVIKQVAANDKRCHLVMMGSRTPKYVGDDNIYKSESNSMPVRSSALESLMKCIWLKESDVWMLGVCMWEIFTAGAHPYKELENATRAMVIDLLKSGHRLEVPPEVPTKVADLVRSCWAADLFKRPSVTMIVDVLTEAIANTV